MHLLLVAIEQNPGVIPIPISERHHQCVIHYLFDGDRNPGAGPQLLGRGLHISLVKCPAWRCSFRAPEPRASASDPRSFC